MQEIFQKAKEGAWGAVKLLLASGLVLTVYVGLIGAGIAIGILYLIEKAFE